MATTAFNSHLAPVADDSMEMSSPANRNLDDDIEIDFDDYPGGVHVTDDEHMGEDTDPMRPGTGTDDMMEDDVLPGEQALAEEEVMQDDGIQVGGVPQEEDEELIDYGEDEATDQLVDDTLIPTVAGDSTAIPETFSEEVVGDEVTQLPGVVIPDVPAPGSVEESTFETAQVQDPPVDVDDLFGPIAHADDDIHAQANDALAGGSNAFDRIEQAIFDSPAHPSADPALAQPPISLNIEVPARTDTPGTPTDTGLHPMNVRYGDLHMPLFKSRRQPSGLLKDDNLANLSLAELIKSCRQRLAIKLGEEISEDQELVLGFEGLGLMLVEDSRAGFESSLSDVLEVYLQLHRNDAIREIPPLTLTISPQLKFASSFSILKHSAAGGQGMSTFGFLQPAEEEEDDDDDDDSEDDEEEDEGGGGHGGRQIEHKTGEEHYEETDEGRYTDGAGYEDFTGEYHDLNHSGEDAGQYDPGEFYHEDHDYQEDATTEGYAAQHTQAPPGLDDLLQGEHQLTDTINNALDESAASGQDTVDKGTSRHLDAALSTANAKEAGSGASSTTEQGDTANNHAAQTSDPHDDFSTFLTEFEADEHEVATTKDDQQALKTGNAAQHVPNHPGGETSNQAFDAQHFGSEDFLNDPGEHEYGDDDHYANQGDEGDYEPGGGFRQDGEEEYYDQADTRGEQQFEEYHPDYEPGNEDEQYHTAQDFFGGEYYEHGPQHDVHNGDEEEDGLDDTVNTVVHHQVEHDDEDAQQDFEDDLGFDDDEDYEQQQEDGEQHKDNAKLSSNVRSGSPPGNKRSFDDLVDEDELDFDEREVKKSRAT